MLYIGISHFADMQPCYEKGIFLFLEMRSFKKKPTKKPLAETTRQDFLGGENVTHLPNSSSAREQHIAEICVYCL